MDPILEAVKQQLADNNPIKQDQQPADQQQKVDENKKTVETPKNDDNPADKSMTPDPKDDDKDLSKDQSKNEPKDKSDDGGTKKIDIWDKFKKVVSYDRFKDINDKYKALKEKMDNIVNNKKDPEFEDEDDKEAYNNLKKLWFTNKDDLEIEKLKMEEQRLKEDEKREFNKEIKILENKFDGSDGLPKFSKDDVIKRGMENQVYDPQSAYIIMNLNDIINHFVQKEVKTVSSKPSFAKQNEANMPDNKDDLKNLSERDWSLQQFLKNKIKAMMSG